MGVLIFAIVASTGWSQIQGYFTDSQPDGFVLGCTGSRSVKWAVNGMRHVIVELWNRHSLVIAIHLQMRWEVGRRHG